MRYKATVVGTGNSTVDTPKLLTAKDERRAVAILSSIGSKATI